jgi:hypothetical protein
MAVGGVRCSLVSKVEVTLRLMVSQSFSQSVCLGVGHPFGPHGQIHFFLLSENCIAVSLGAPSLTRGWVCNL